MTETTKRKAKRKLSSIDFSKEGAHLALVSEEQGGPANGHDYALVLKANKFSEEFVEKMQQVKVTMELPDFLRKFFGMYYEDSELLAAMMGYEKPEGENEPQEVENSYEDYIQARLEAFEILKTVNDAESLADALSELDETEYLAMLHDQERLEKAFKKAAKESKPVAKAVADDTSIASEVKVEEVSASVNQEELEKSMTQEVKTVEQEVTVEMVEKSALESVQKALEEQKVALEKAMETISQFEAEKKMAIEKARKAEVVAAVKDEAKAEILFKAVKDAADEDFQAVVKALSEMTAAVEQSDLFVEKGASAQEEPVIQESAVAKLLKAKQAK
jgi:hypothetical protein